MVPLGADQHFCFDPWEGLPLTTHEASRRASVSHGDGVKSAKVPFDDSMLPDLAKVS